MPSQSNWLAGATPITPRTTPHPATSTNNAPATTSNTVAFAIQTHLKSKHLPPNPIYLHHLIQALPTTSPIPALKASALYKILHSDLKTSLATSTSNTFPANVTDPDTPTRRLDADIVAQVLLVEDVGNSRWSQVEAIDAFERGELTKGREIIRVVPGDDAFTNHGSTGEDGAKEPHKLLLEDGRGTRAWAFEVAPVEGVGVTMGIGCKVLVRGAEICRGVLMLEGEISVLGGKVEEWDRKWKEGRRAWLVEGVTAANNEIG